MFYFQSLLWKFNQKLRFWLLSTHFRLACLRQASAGNWAGGFWQIVSVKETNNLIQCVSGPRVHSAALFYFLLGIRSVLHGSRAASNLEAIERRNPSRGV